MNAEAVYPHGIIHAWKAVTAIGIMKAIKWWKTPAASAVAIIPPVAAVPMGTPAIISPAPYGMMVAACCPRAVMTGVRGTPKHLKNSAATVTVAAE